MAGSDEKWLRICAGGCKDKACSDLAGKTYPLDQEAEAKKDAHDGCKCTAKKVKPCEGAMGVGDLSIDAASTRSGRDVSVTATATNTGSSPLTAITLHIEISAAGMDLLNKSYSLGDLAPNASTSQSDSFTIPFTKVPKVMAAQNDDDISTVATAEYTKDGSKKKAANGCYNKAE